MRSLALFALVGALLFAVPVLAQDAASTSAGTNTEILIQKIKADKKLLVAGNMDLTDAESKKFWPLYDAYQKELQKLNQRLGTTIKEYADAYNKGPIPKD
jgi:Spy/CpxP family protein refolding chaperone